MAAKRTSESMVIAKRASFRGNGQVFILSPRILIPLFGADGGGGGVVATAGAVVVVVVIPVCSAMIIYCSDD